MTLLAASAYRSERFLSAATPNARNSRVLDLSRAAIVDE
jgi:hypothetical protein